MRKVTAEEKFRQAAWAYFVYGLAYWLGAIHLGRQESLQHRGEYWYWIGAVFIILFPWLIASGTRGKGYLWFCRILTLLMAHRVYGVAQVALTSEGETVPLPWRGEISLRTGAFLFLALTVVALGYLVRAAWLTRIR